MRRGITLYAILVAVIVLLPVGVACKKNPPIVAPTTATTSATTKAITTTSVTVPQGTTATPKATPGPSGQYGDLKIAVVSFSSGTLDPIRADPQVASLLLVHVYDWMFRMEAGKLVPGIIEKWAPAQDGLSWTYNVRRGVKFQDGSDLTAKDVKFSIERYASKDALYSQFRNIIDHVDIVDDYTVRVFTKSPQPFLPTYSTDLSPASGLVMAADYFNKNGAEYAVQHPMGSGPWQFVKYTAGDSIQFAAKEKHWRQTPAFKTLNIILVPEASTRLAMVKTGEIDVTDVSLADSAALEKAGFTTYPMVAVQVRMNLEGTLDPRAKGMPLADIRVRQALALAINQDDISKNLFYGKALPLMPPRVLYGQDDVDTDALVKYSKEFYQYNTTKAKQLLAEAGYADGLNLKLFVTEQPGVAYIGSLAAVVQSQWQAIGVKASLVPQELSTYLVNRKEPADEWVGNANFGTTSTLAPPIVNLEVMWGSKGLNPLTSRNSPQGIQAFTPDLDKLIYAALVEVDSAKRKALIAQVIKMGMDTHTAIPFGQVPVMMAVGPKVTFSFKQPLEHAYLANWADIAQHK
ncbi:MAG: ABC transporter substrate-binding protein [Chloroflexi bacterium]|nr:ABC transporter substrate-binding protein [Chloroflexota bacterium]